MYEQRLGFSTCSFCRVYRGKIATARPGRPPKEQSESELSALRWWGHVTDRPQSGSSGVVPMVPESSHDMVVEMIAVLADLRYDLIYRH